MRLDLLITNAQGYTLDAAHPRVHRVGVLHGRIVGLDDELDGIPATETVDLEGRTLLPGFVDAHNHLAWTGLAARSVNLAGARTVEEALRRIGAAAAAAAPDAWVDGVGYDQRPLGRHLTRHDLDRVSAGRRVYLIHTSGHAHLVSSAVLAGLDLPDEPGIVRDEGGRPTGLFLEEATRLVAAVRTPHPVAELRAALARAAAQCAAEGVTFAAEAGIGGGLVARSPIEVQAYQEAVELGQLPIRVQLMASIDTVTSVPAHPDDGVTRAFPLGLRSGFGSDRLSLGAVKAWLDGGMMARTAALSEPYIDSDEAGALASAVPELTAAAVDAHVAGWQLALHAIGDRAIDVALDIVEQAQRVRPRPDARHRIEHCGLVRPDQLARLTSAGVVAVTQPSFLYEFGDDYAAIMGPARAEWMYRGRSYLDHGIPLAGSSDRPVADGAPLRAIQFMVERRSAGGTRIGAAEAIGVEAALHAYTLGAAYACRVEDRLGSITVGKHADFVVLDGDPFTVAASELAGIPVAVTVVAGQPVHGAWPA